MTWACLFWGAPPPNKLVGVPFNPPPRKNKITKTQNRGVLNQKNIPATYSADFVRGFRVSGLLGRAVDHGHLHRPAEQRGAPLPGTRLPRFSPEYMLAADLEFGPKLIIDFLSVICYLVQVIWVSYQLM